MMNLAELKEIVVERLQERDTPVHWTETEITRYLNRGVKEIVKRTKSREQVLPLVPTDLSNGLFAFPLNIMKQSGVYWEGKRLQQTTTDFMDSYYRGTTSDFQRGAAESSFLDWRQETADEPSRWMIDDGQIRLFPIPSALATAAEIRQVQSGTLTAGTTDITLGTPLPDGVVDPVPAALSSLASLRTVHEVTLTAGAVDIVIAGSIHENQDLVDVFANGVYQNKDQWSRLNATTIRMVGSFAVDQTIEVVQFGLVAFYQTKPTKYVLSLSAGDTVVPVPNGYELGENAVAIKINGINQAPSSFTETSEYVITLASPLAADSYVEVNVYDRYTETFQGNKDLVDVFLNGVYQNKDQWSIVNNTTIRMVGSLVVDADFEVVYYSQGMSTGIKIYKYTTTKLAGVQAIVTPRPYEVGNNAISIRINGITQAPSAFTETSSNVITLASALTWESEIEFTIYERTWTGSIAMKTVRAPTDMASDDDLPDLPDHFGEYHDAIWKWALFECYSRDGQEGDPNKASLNLQLFLSDIKEFLDSFSAPVEMTPRDKWNI